MGRSYLARAAAALGFGDNRAAPDGKHRLLGDKARDAGDWGLAAEHYRSYLRVHPDSFAIWVQLGHALKEAGDLARAEEAYLRAERLDPDDADLALNLGHLMKSMRRLADAELYYTRSFQIDGNAHAGIELERIGVATEEEATPSPKPIQQGMAGSVDEVRGCVVRGWAVEPDPGDGPAQIEAVNADGHVVATGVATRIRSDVAAAGYTDGPSGFTLVIDHLALSGNQAWVDVRLRSNGASLSGSPVIIGLPEQADADAARRISAARYVMPKTLDAIGGEHAIFVAYAATGMLHPFVRPFLRMLRDRGVAVSLVVNTDRPVALDDDLLDLVASVVVRENKGYDFGAWAHMLRLEPKLYAAECLYIINDSIVGPSNDTDFAAMMVKVRQKKADLLGLTETLERGWHVQSYFLRISAPLLQSYAFQLFVNSIAVIADKDAIINAFEVPLARRVAEAGFTVDSVFKIDEARNPTLFAWNRLLAAGFPFVKHSLLRNGFEHLNTEGLAREMKRAGFDMKAVEAARDYRSDEPPPPAGFPLLARAKPSEADKERPQKPYKVAFYGPWNYDNGLGSASRGIISAIRQAGVRLNLHPIRKPFHVHKPLGPAHDVLDFDGAADVAIVHLNPDSWHLLTDDQRAQIDRAKRRIGYWVWEMEELPTAWQRDFGSVDRIWAPSGYNAQAFAAAKQAPVDVIPHVVPVAGKEIADRLAIRRALALPAERRLILYVFDGASYLVRKNPAALLRAFAASDLAEQGWSLVLKTKHLMDRPGEGRELAALAEATEGVVLLDRSLSSHELSDLVASCDIYASPHCSEGFGLTVAEAMAAGRIVVATDYSGTTQFLDQSCGFPVAAEPWTLEEDFGHYLSGGTWARVDEAALADGLVRAAARVDAGDETIGEAARARVAAMLSAEAVGAAIAASLDAVIHDDEPVRQPVPVIEDAGAGVDLAVLADEGSGGLAVLSLTEGTLAAEADGLADVANDRDAWAVIAPAGARLHPHTANILARYAGQRPDVAIFYGDDVAYSEETLLEQVRLKPQFDRTLFAAQDYIGAPLFVRGPALHELGGLRPSLGDAALYDLVLRAAEQGMSIERIPEVLLVQGKRRVRAPQVGRRAMLEQSPLYAGYDITEGPAPQTLALSRRFEGEWPHVTLCVPTRRSAIDGGEGSYIERLLHSLAHIEWPADRLTVLVGDDVEGEASWIDHAWPFELRRIETPRAPGEPFNFSAKMNRLWRAAESDLVVLLNDDVVAERQDWLRALISFAVERDLGAVGPRLLYDDGTIQHAGVYGGVMGTSAHAWLGLEADAPSYQDWALTQREVSMTTGAVLATRRSVLEAIGGFDERFTLEFNDIDLCLKMRQQGYRIVYNPMAELTHSEKKSRGDTAPPGEQLALFLARWHDWLADDPALPPNMRRDMLDLTPRAGAADWFV